MNKITPCLWFDENAEEAVNFYTSIFTDAKISNVVRYPKDAHGPEGKVMTIAFQLRGENFLALNGGPYFNFTPAISFIVDCDSQQEIDHYWDALASGGEVEQCGWLKDKFGISWQIVPSILQDLMQDKDPAKVQRVSNALLQMIKLDIAALQKAYDLE